MIVELTNLTPQELVNNYLYDLPVEEHYFYNEIKSSVTNS